MVSINLDFEIDDYAFCHPANVTFRKGHPKLSKWWHLIGHDGITFTLRYEEDTGFIRAITLSTKELSLEYLANLPKLLLRGLQIINAGRWLYFKWTTRMGNTQFQIATKSVDSMNSVVRAIESHGLIVERRGAFPTEYILGKSAIHPSQLARMRRISPTLDDLQATLVADTQVGGRDTLMDSQTQQTLDGLYLEQETQRSFNSEATSVDLPADDLYAKAENVEVASGSGKVCLDPKSINVRTSIDGGVPINLAVDSFSAAKPYGSGTKALRWSHVGLASGMCLSLIPEKGDLPPYMSLSRGMEEFGSYSPALNILRATRTSETLVLSQFAKERSGYCIQSVVQLHMVDANINVVTEWLSFWNVVTEDQDRSLGYTEPTTIYTGSMQIPTSDSDRSRFWRNNHPRSRLSHSSRLSNFSYRTGTSRLSRGSA